jgi:hypothetical protein
MRTFHRWLFGFGSPFTFGVFRILAASLCFINLAMVGLQFGDWYTESGLSPVGFAPYNHGGIWRLSLLNQVADARITGAVYLLTMLASLSLAFGAFSRISAAVLFIGVASLHNRTMDILHSGDTLMRAWCFILLIGPSHAALSVDRWRRVRRGLLPVESVALWPHRLIAIQLAIVYLTTAWHKLLGTHWIDGTATWFTSQLTEFHRFPMPGFMSTQPWIAIQTYYTLAIEIALGTLVFWRPARTWVVVGGLLLHAGIEYSMNIPLFAFIICAGYVGYYSGEELKAAMAKLSRFGKKGAERAADAA